MSDTLYFFVPMQPPSVTSQQKRACRVGNGIRFFKSKTQKSADSLYFALLQPHRPEKPLEGPLSLSVTFTLPWRKSERKAIQREFAAYPCSTRPDCSNRIKQLEDVMTALRFWEDDGQIAELTVRKEYGDEPGVQIMLRPSHPLKRT